MKSHPLESFEYCPKCASSFAVHNEKSKICSSCGFTYYFNISAAVVAFIFNEKNELLVCRRAHEPFVGTLDLPGGFVDEGESAEKAIAREVQEELSLEVLSLNYLFSKPNLYPYSGFVVHTLDLFFKCTVRNFKQLAANDDVSESFFLPIDKIDSSLFGLESIRLAVKQLKESSGLSQNVDI